MAANPPPSFPLLHRLSAAAGVVTVLTGLAALAGWVFDVEYLKSVLPGLMSMKPNTALAFVLAGAALWLLRARPSQEVAAARYRVGAQGLAAAVGLIGVATLAEYLFGWELGIDQLLFADNSRISVYPGRMAAVSALNFALLGGALLLIDTETRRGYRPAQLLVLPAVILALFGLVNYLYGVEALYRVTPFSSLALHATIAFLLLCAGILLARPDRGLMAVVVAEGTAGIALRYLLPAAIVVPIGAGWLRLQGERAGLYGFEFGLALFALANVVVFMVLIGWSARVLHRVDTERARAERALRASQAMFQGLYEFSPDAIVAVNRAGRIARVNAQAERLFGYAREEMLGQPVELLIPQRFAEQHERDRRDYAARPRPRPMGAGLELYARRKDGGEFPADVNLGPLETEDGTLVLSTVRDITERKRIEEALSQQARELSRSNADLERFAYVASHDLQEPLRMVSSFTQLLARRYQGKLGPDADEYIGYAVSGAARMQQLINDLLAYSRVGTRGRPLTPVPVEDMLAEVLADLQVAIHESGAVVTHGTLPTVAADATQLRQLLQNLVGNAIKFRGERPPRIQVSAELREHSGAKGEAQWLFAVRDTGIGIAPEYRDRIFLIFQRLHTAQEYPGTGIGLALCKRIVERHGGHIWVESEPGQGSVFYFTLPEWVAADKKRLETAHA